jgi:hypothetical protein
MMHDTNGNRQRKEPFLRKSKRGEMSPFEKPSVVKVECLKDRLIYWAEYSLS